jgi:hypothetical protein
VSSKPSELRCRRADSVDAPGDGCADIVWYVCQPCSTKPIAVSVT